MDIKLTLAGVLIIGSVIGLASSVVVGDRFVQSEATTQFDEAASLPAPAPAPAPAPGPALVATSWTDNLTLPRAHDGHFYAQIDIDGRTARLMVDTGASVVALTGADARALGLLWDDSAIGVVAQGASGPVLGVPVMLPRIALGGFEVENVPAIIVPEGLFVSLLGQSFLERLGKVEIAGETMIVSS
jgi:aspartyl protease family protein